MNVETAPYEVLNDRQQALVDAIATMELDTGEEFAGSHSDTPFTADDVADVMAETFDTEPYANMYGGNAYYLHQRRDLIDERKQVLPNIRSDNGGEVTLESDTGTYTGPATGIDLTEQYITERPADVSVDTDEDRFEITVELTFDEVLSTIRSADEQTARDLFEQLVT